MTAGGPPDDPPPDLSGDWHLDVEPSKIREAAQETENSSQVTANHVDVSPAPISTVSLRGVSADSRTTRRSDAVRRRASTHGRGRVRGRSRADARAVPHRHRCAHPTLSPPATALRDSGSRRRLRPGRTAVVPRTPRSTLRRTTRGATRASRHSTSLSVVAYRQPVEKAEVDAIRGMDSGASPSTARATRARRGAAPRRGRKPRRTLRHHPAISPTLQPRLARRTPAPGRYGAGVRRSNHRPRISRSPPEHCHTPRTSG